MPSFRREEQEIQKASRELLADVGLLDRGNALAKISRMENSGNWKSQGLWRWNRNCYSWMTHRRHEPAECEDIMRLVERIQKRESPFF